MAVLVSSCLAEISLTGLEATYEYKVGDDAIEISLVLLQDPACGYLATFD